MTDPYWIDRLYYDDMIDMTLIIVSILIGYLYGSMSYLIPGPLTVSGGTGLMTGRTVLVSTLEAHFRFSLFCLIIMLIKPLVYFP